MTTITASAPLGAPPRPLSVDLRKTAVTLGAFVAITALVALVLHITGGVDLVSSAISKDVEKPTNFGLLDSTAKTIKGNILYFFLLILPVALAFSGACILVGARLGQDLLGKIIGAVVFIVGISPAVVA